MSTMWRHDPSCWNWRTVGQTARVDGDVNRWLENAATVYQMWRRKMFRSQSGSKKTKFLVFWVMMMSALLNGAETYTYRPSLNFMVSQRQSIMGHCWSDLVGARQEMRMFWKNRGSTNGRPVRTWTTSVVWSPPEDGRALATMASASWNAGHRTWRVVLMATVANLPHIVIIDNFLGQGDVQRCSHYWNDQVHRGYEKGSRRVASGICGFLFAQLLSAPVWRHGLALQLS